MAAVQATHTNSQPSQPGPLPTQLSSRTSNLSSSLSPSQLEAHQILAHLLDQLQHSDSRYEARYSSWISRHPDLNAFCHRCIRPQVWTFISSNRWSLDGLKLIAGDLKHEGRAIYLDGVFGLDKRIRIYIGQSISLRQRVAQHLNFRYRRDNPSLHYHAMQKSIYNTIGALAVLPPLNATNQSLPGMDAPDLLLNVLEMWMCLVFRTLPDETLAAWLPDDGTVNKSRKEGREGVFGGLNIASPLDNGQRQREWVDLSESEDPLVREYLGVDRKADLSDVKHVGKKAVDESPAQRQKSYAEHARRFNEAAQNDIRVPRWVAIGALVAMVGIVVLNGRSASVPKGRWR